MSEYEIIDHTADIGVIVRGESLEEIFEKSAYALFDLQVALETVQTVEKKIVYVKGDDLEQTLVRWLQELLVIMELENFICHRFEMKMVDETGAHGAIWGETLDEKKHELKGHIKAVTYYGLEIQQTEEDGWKAQIIFDV